MYIVHSGPRVHNLRGCQGVEKTVRGLTPTFPRQFEHWSSVSSLNAEDESNHHKATTAPIRFFVKL